MHFDYGSLLLGLSFSGLCLAIILMARWTVRRSETFMMTWGAGVSLMVVGLLSYHAYVSAPGLWLGISALVFFLAGFSAFLAAARQFRIGGSSLLTFSLCLSFSVSLTVPWLVVGYDGVAFIFLNLLAAALLIASGVNYWKAKAQAPDAMRALSLLYTLAGMSFLPCAGVLLSEERWVLGRAPSNWAEDLNILVSIFATTGAGAISLTLHQARQTARHLRESLTDALTGLTNRRGLFESMSLGALAPATAIIAFDIDHFKQVNDKLGHAAGDMALKAFSNVLMEGREPDDIAARMGGEEFLLVLRDAIPSQARRIAEEICNRFRNLPIIHDGVVFSCSVSAGIAFGESSFENALRVADAALYDAKHQGRDQVVGAFPLHSVTAPGG